MSADIFISYASQDAKIATTISAAIESRGFKCWISSRDILPGENFQSAIVRAIRSSKILLLVFTSNSNRSDEMTKELALASQQKLMVVPLRVEDVTPSDAFAYEFATRQWIDLFADWELAMNQLCTRLGAALANEPHSTDPIVLGKPAAESQASRPVPTVNASTPTRASAKAPPPPGSKAAVKPSSPSPLIKIAIGAAALIAAAAVAVPTLMKRPAATSTPATAAAVAAPKPATEPALVVAVAPTADQPSADQPATAVAAEPAPAAPNAIATAPGPAATPAAALAPAAVAAAATAPASRDTASKELPREPAKPVERKKRVAAQRSSSNVPY